MKKMEVPVKRVDFVEHRGKKILRLDFSGLTPEELAGPVREAQEIIRDQPPSSLLTMTCVDGARFNNQTIETLKEFAKGNESFVSRAALVGLEGLQKLVLTAVSKFTGRNFYVCGDEEEAKERLTAEI